MKMRLTSQKNSFPLSPQNHDIQDTSSELLILLTNQHSRSEPIYTQKG